MNTASIDSLARGVIEHVWDMEMRNAGQLTMRLRVEISIHLRTSKTTRCDVGF